MLIKAFNTASTAAQVQADIRSLPQLHDAIIASHDNHVAEKNLRWGIACHLQHLQQ